MTNLNPEALKAVAERLRNVPNYAFEARPLCLEAANAMEDLLAHNERLEREKEEAERLLKVERGVSALLTTQRDDNMDEVGRMCGRLQVSEARAQQMEEALREIGDAPTVPKNFTYTGTSPHDLEALFDAELRHSSGKKPIDYLHAWLAMLRPFAFATRDGSWGEMEKLLCTVLRNYVTMALKAEKARAALSTTKTEEAR